MKFTEFKKQIDSDDVRSVYLFEGEDAFFKRRAVFLLKQKIDEPSFNLAVFEEDYKEDDILASVNSFPMLSQKRLTIAHEFYPDTFGLKKIKNYIENPSPSSILAIVNGKASDALKKLDGVTVVNCDKESPSVLSSWIKNECKKYEVNIDDVASMRLVEYCASDMSKIEQETLKVASYVGKGGTVSEQIVKELVALDSEYKIYEMTDYIGKRQIGKALEVINDMMSRGEPSQKLIVSIYNYFRRLLFLGISNLPLIETAKQLGMNEYPARKAKEQAGKFKIKSLKKAVDILEDADYLFKSGNGDADSRMWLSIFQIMLEE